ncbi:MAG: OmpH family outer membrane protein [Porticoccaceae bacterium]
MLHKQIKFFALMVVIATLPSMSLAADTASSTKIAVVDARVAIFGSAAAQAAVKEFEESADFINLKAKYESSSADFQAMAKEAETKRLTWSPEELAEHQKKMSYVKADAELAIQKLTSEQKQLEQRILQTLAPLVEKAINEIVKEEGISILLRAESVLTAAPEMSITAKVANRIDAKSKPKPE